jgi:hypothetical protein
VIVDAVRQGGSMRDTGSAPPARCGGRRRPVPEPYRDRLEALLRKAAARSRDELRAAVGRRLDTVPEAECTSRLRHCGYGTT